MEFDIHCSDRLVMRVILRSASPRQLALFTLVFTYFVSLNFVAFCTGPCFLAILCSISFSARIHVIRLYFISFALYPQRRRHSISWGYTVPIFPIVGFFGFRALACS